MVNQLTLFKELFLKKKIIEFIEKSLGEKILEDHTEFYESVSDLIKKGEFKKSKEILENFLANHSDEFKSFAMYIDCLGHLEQYKEAHIFSESLSEEALSNNLIKSSLQKITIKKKNSKGPSLNNLINDLEKKPDDLEIILKLANKYFAENMLDDAFKLLLINFKKNREEIKSKFLEFFEALGNENEKTHEYRKKLSSIMFS